MPSADTSAAVVRREADTLHFDGALMRPVVASLWQQAGDAKGVNRFDLSRVSAIDSAGLALLAALAAKTGHAVTIHGSPANYAELRQAYRLDEQLGFASS